MKSWMHREEKQGHFLSWHLWSLNRLFSIKSNPVENKDQYTFYIFMQECCTILTFFIPANLAGFTVDGDKALVTQRGRI